MTTRMPTPALPNVPPPNRAKTKTKRMVVRQPQYPAEPPLGADEDLPRLAQELRRATVGLEESFEAASKRLSALKWGVSAEVALPVDGSLAGALGPAATSSTGKNQPPPVASYWLSFGWYEGGWRLALLRKWLRGDVEVEGCELLEFSEATRALKIKAAQALPSLILSLKDRVREQVNDMHTARDEIASALHELENYHKYPEAIGLPNSP